MAGVVKSFLKGVAYFRPQGFLDANAVSQIITPLDMRNIELKNIKFVSIDMKKIIATNIAAMKFLNDIFEMLYKKNVECSIFNLNKNIYELSVRLESRFFNIYENEEIEKVFTSEEKINKPIYLCGIKNEENRNMIIYNLVKKGYTPIVINSEDEIKEEGIVIKKSIISKFAKRVSAIVKNNIVYFYLDGFLDNQLVDAFDIEYFRRSLLVGFRVFVFDMNNVKGLNVHGVRFLSKLGVEAAEYGALLAIVGLNSSNVQKKLLEDLEVVGFVFFATEGDLLNSKELKEAQENMSAVFKKGKKITKDFVQILPYFVNSTITTIELLTGIKATKEQPAIREVNIDLDNTKYIASSIGFYGDVDGLLVLIFADSLTKKVSEILLGEVVKDEELNDIVSEFANIIVGNVKSEFQKVEIEIDLTLPKVFQDLQELNSLVEKRNGIEVKFYFEGEEFYFYLIRS